MTVAREVNPIGCKRSDPKLDKAETLNVGVGSTHFTSCKTKLNIGRAIDEHRFKLRH